MFSPVPRIFPALAIAAMCLTLTACYEDEAEVTINADGSGTFTQKIVMSEQVAYAMDHSDKKHRSGPGPFWMTTQEQLQEELGDACTIDSLTITDKDDLSRVIEIKGSFDSAAAFFGSKYVKETLGLEAQKVGGKARITWHAYTEKGDIGPNIDQMYGMAKGLKVTRKINAPAAITAEHGQADGRSITWTVDLTDREALAGTKERQADTTDGKWGATFDIGALELADGNVAAVDAAEIARQADEGDGGVIEASADAVGLKAEVIAVTWNKVARVSANHPAGDSTLNVQVLLTWPDGKRPESYYDAKLTSLKDDQGNSLVDEDGQAHSDRRQRIWEHNENQDITLMAQPPDSDAKALLDLEGSVKIVAAITTETVTLQDPKDLAGKPTGHATLDKLGLKIKKVGKDVLKVEFNEGVEFDKVIKSVVPKKADGTPIDSHGWSGWNNNVTYNFAEDVSTAASIDFEVVTGETIVEVPFDVEEVKLP